MLGIIPAAGIGSRWGNYYKDLLPINSGEFLLNNAIETAAINFGCDKVLLVTSREKIHIHANHLSTHRPSIPVSYVLTYGARDMWQGIEPALDLFPNDNMVLIMPDTIFETDIHKNITAPLAFGVFETQEPERFSVLHNGGIVTKNPALKKDDLWYKAWGCVYWNTEVGDLWRNSDFKTYDDAFEAAIRYFGFATFDLYKYYDMANFEEYLKYIKDRY